MISKYDMRHQSKNKHHNSRKLLPTTITMSQQSPETCFTPTNLYVDVSKSFNNNKFKQLIFEPRDQDDVNE